MTSNHTNLKALNDWCQSTGDLYLSVVFNHGGRGEEMGWSAKVCPNHGGKWNPIRSLNGPDLEAVCAEMLPLAQAEYEKQKDLIGRKNIAANKKYAAELKRDMRELYEMHRTADDY